MKQFTLSFLFASLLTSSYAAPQSHVISHKIAKGETLYSISKHYGLKPQEVAKFNDAPGENMTIQICQIIRIPTKGELDVLSEETTEVENLNTIANNTIGNKVYNNTHTVVKGETIFSISKANKISADELKEWNNLGTKPIKVGQVLIINNEDSRTSQAMPVVKQKEFGTSASSNAKRTIANTKMVSTAGSDVTASLNAVGMSMDARPTGGWRPESTSERMEAFRNKPIFDPSAEYETLYYQNVYSGMNKKVESGIAKLLVDNNATNIAYYNNAPIGTILKITNPLNGKSSYAIVIGKIPPTESSYAVKLGGKVAKGLLAKDYSSLEISCYAN
jgi:hypothetical protein